jgi:hypothetical protein
MHTTSETAAPAPRQAKRRREVHAPVRFKADDRQALHAAQYLLPRAHLARQVWALLSRLDTSALQAQYSPLGQHPFHPLRLLALWVYASLIGVHHATKLHARLRTDAALLFLSGGHVVSRKTLGHFRSRNESLFRLALQATVRWAHEEGLVDVERLALDSVRLQGARGTQ